MTEERQAALAEALGELSDVRARLLAAEAEVRERDDMVSSLDEQVEVLQRETDRLAAQLAEAGAALDRARLVRLARLLDTHAPPVAAAVRRLRDRGR